MQAKKSLKAYRKGAAGSLMDEYERAASELKNILQNVSDDTYTTVADAETESEHCRSIQTIMNHVVRSGYSYAKYMREALSMNTITLEEQRISQAQICAEIDKMLAYTVEIFEGRWETIEEQMLNIYINARWGVIYNIDQLFEHAIVHILRHRRQIEKFLLKLETAPLN